MSDASCADVFSIAIMWQTKPRRGVDAADVQQCRNGRGRDIFKERHVDKEVQPHRAIERRARRRAAEEQNEHELARAEEKTQARNSDAAEARCTLFAEHTVECEHHGGENGEHRACGIERRMNGVNDDERRRELQNERDNVVAMNVLMQEEMGEHRDEDRIAGEDDRHD